MKYERLYTADEVDGMIARAKAKVAAPVAWNWDQAPVKTSWGHDMVVADLAIDKDHTVSVYCERDQIAKVEAMFTTPPAAPVQTNCRHCGGPDNVLCAGQCKQATPPAAQRQHVTDGSLCWCDPETSYTDPETGASVVVHKGPQ